MCWPKDLGFKFQAFALLIERSSLARVLADSSSVALASLSFTSSQSLIASDTSNWTPADWGDRAFHKASYAPRIRPACQSSQAAAIIWEDKSRYALKSPASQAAFPSLGESLSKSVRMQESEAFTLRLCLALPAFSLSIVSALALIGPSWFLEGASQCYFSILKANRALVFDARAKASLGRVEEWKSGRVGSGICFLALFARCCRATQKEIIDGKIARNRHCAPAQALRIAASKASCRL